MATSPLNSATLGFHGTVKVFVMEQPWEDFTVTSKSPLRKFGIVTISPLLFVNPPVVKTLALASSKTSME